IEGIKTIESTSREESSSVSITFLLSREIDAAANDVRDRVARVVGRLPEEADVPRVAKTEADARPIMWVAMTSDRMDGLELTDYAERFLVDRLSIVPGVASIRIGAKRRYAMRVWLDKYELAARELTVRDVEAALERQNVELPSGRIESLQREFAVRTESGLKTPEEFRKIVVKDDAGYLVRLGEVARVEVGAEDDRSELRANGRNAVGLGVVKQSKANTLDVANGIREVVEILRPTLPEGMGLDVSYDKSLFISQSIKEVFIALSIAFSLVLAVIFFFLRSFRATIIPVVAIPVSVIAAFIVLAALDYSVNVLTLLALVLAIGLVVDDAIVVLENIHRHIEDGEPPLLASVRGARQIAFAVIATTLVLVAVFIPISFLEGNTGRLFREFGVAVAAAVIFSSFVALSLTPMMCSKWLRAARDEGVLYRVTEPMFEAMRNGYRWLLERALAMPIVVVALAVAVSGVAYNMFEALPREFAPIEDRGIIFIPISAPEGSSLEYTRRYVLEIERELLPLVDEGIAARVFTILAPGFGRPGQVNSAFSFLRLRDWDEREITQQEVSRKIFPMLLAVPGVRAYAVNPPSLGHRSFRAPVQMVLGGPSYEVLSEWRDQVLERARENPRLLNVNSDYEETRPELRVEIERNRAADLGVSIEDIGRNLETMLGSRFVTTYSKGGKEYNVVLQARPEDRQTPGDLSNIYVRSRTTGRLILLANLVTYEESAGARQLNRVDRLRAITISASLAPGYTMGEALGFLESVARDELPGQVRITWKGVSREYKDSSSALYFTFGMALLIVFLVLAGQFESFIHPFIIILAVPLALTGALGAMLWAGLSVNVYTQIGMIMLIGLIAKNGILIVEFANQLRDRGQDIRSAVSDASVIRLRPILMTTIATAFGAMPLAFATGAGAEAREALGMVIIGGVSFASLLSLFVVPVLYLALARFTKPTGHIERLLTGMETEYRDAAPSAAE
ncbi:MAG: efflux RND transporter permease subunit, partial [Alphaproteobacteria bacterium]